MNEAEPAVSLNIVILPSEAVSQQAIAMSEEIAKKVATKFVLQNGILIPHDTLYQAQFPTRNIDTIKQRLKEIASRKRPFKLSLGQFDVRYTNFLFWNIETSIREQALHESIVESLNSLREGLILPALTNTDHMPQGDREDVEHYGSLLIGPRRLSHITITRLSRAEDAEKALKITGYTRQVEFTVNQIALAYLGENGTVTEIIETFPFAT